MAAVSKSTSQPSYDFSCLRALRKRETLTIGEVSQRSGVSAAVISKLERNQSRGELDTLFRIARVFGMSATDLIALAESRTAQRAEAAPHTGGGFTFQEVAYGNVCLLYGKAPKGAELSRPEVHRDDYEVCWILKGRLQFTLPHEKHVLGAGEAIQFDAILHHTYEALEDTELVMVHMRKAKRF